MEPERHPVSDFTENERYNNFMKIMTTTQYLDDGGIITPEWLEEHKQLILQYRQWISDYTDVNDEIEDKSFRKCCEETETLLRQLCHSIWTTGKFSVQIYHLFIRHMKHMLEVVYSEDILMDMMGGLSM